MKTAKGDGSFWSNEVVAFVHGFLPRYGVIHSKESGSNSERKNDSTPKKRYFTAI